MGMLEEQLRAERYTDLEINVDNKIKTNTYHSHLWHLIQKQDIQ